MATEHQCEDCGATYESLDDAHCVWLSAEVQTFYCNERTGLLRLRCNGLVHAVQHESPRPLDPSASAADQ